MTGLSVTLLVLAGGTAVADWWAVGQGNKTVEYVVKPATTLLLLLCALSLDIEGSAFRNLFLLGLALSLVGDVLLLLPDDRFVAGVAAFLLAHLAYTGGFASVDTWWVTLVLGLVAVGLALIPVGVPVMRAVVAEDPGLVWPVAVYMVVICWFMAMAAASGAPVAVAGAALFVVSDAVVAWNRFVSALAWAPVAVMVTYHLAQAGLVLGLV